MLRVVLRLDKSSGGVLWPADGLRDGGERDVVFVNSSTSPCSVWRVFYKQRI